MRSIVLLPLVAALALVSLACDDGDKLPSNAGTTATQAPSNTASSSQDAGLPSACSLLTEAEVTAAIGNPPNGTQEQPANARLATCQWDGTAGSDTRYLILKLRNADDGPKALDDNFRNQQGAQTISGIGEEAIALPGANAGENYRYSAIGAISGGYFVEIDIAGPARDDPEALSVLTAALAAALSRLN